MQGECTLHEAAAVAAAAAPAAVVAYAAASPALGDPYEKPLSDKPKARIINSYSFIRTMAASTIDSESL